MIQVILLEKIVNLGDLGDVVNVRSGYARNYLLPKRMAQRATPRALQEFEDRRAELERLEAEKLSSAKALAEKLSGYSLQISQKAGVDGRLFGSVTNMNVAEALQEAGFTEITKAQVRMPDGSIKAVGEYPLEIFLHADVSTDVILTVQGEMA